MIIGNFVGMGFSGAIHYDDNDNDDKSRVTHIGTAEKRGAFASQIWI